MELYFSDIFKGQNVVFNAALISHLIARLDNIISVDDKQSKVDDTTAELLRLSKPKLWNPTIPNNAEVDMERNYQRLLLIMGEHTNQDLEDITIHKFYSLIAYIKEKNTDNG